MTENYLLLMVSSICFMFSQAMISSMGIGNRVYANKFEKSYLLSKTSFLNKLIFYKPKHYGQYSLFEIANYFAGLIQFLIIVIVYLIGWIFNFALILDIVNSRLIMGIIGVIFVLLVINQLTFSTLNDLYCKKEEKEDYKVYCEKLEREREEKKKLKR